MLPQADSGEAAQSVCRAQHHLSADFLSLEKELRRCGIGRCETAHPNPIQSSFTVYRSLRQLRRSSSFHRPQPLRLLPLSSQVVLDFRDKPTAIIALGFGNAQRAARHFLAPRPNQFYTIPILPRYPVKSVVRLRSIHSLEN